MKYILIALLVFPLSAYAGKVPITQPRAIHEVLLDHFEPDIMPHMYQIALAESNLRPNAFNPEAHKNCRGSYGLFQIACVNYKGNPEDLFDIETNVMMARVVFDRQGFNAWGVCTNGTLQCDIMPVLLSKSNL
jgi:hypothetical protein